MSATGVLPDGTWIDHFRIVRRLGRGGFGVTYLAEEFREWEAGVEGATPLRRVAIKEYFPRGLASRVDGNTVSLSPDVEGAEQTFHMALKGFFQEAESLMRFDHPHVIKIHRVFRRNGTAYYVMPFLHGETLKAILRREGALAEDRARRLMLPILDGLIHAHAKGILHRDLKPDNVMVPDEGGPVLIDFGAARAQALDDAADYTRHSELVAYTPGYAALEQYGRATRDNPHGAQTDVYGLAAVLYHCVTGQAPVEASLRSMQLSNGAADPLLPASAVLAGSSVHARLFLGAIDWGLELAGRNRPQTVADFRRALDGELALPALTLARLEQHGVFADSFTRVGPADPAVAVPEAATAGPTRRALGGTDTVLVPPPSRPTAPGDPITARPPTPDPSTRPDAPAATLTPISPPPSPASTRRSGPLLPLLGLVVSLAAVIYVAREQMPESLRSVLPAALREGLWPSPPAPSGTAVAPPPAAVEPVAAPPPVTAPPEEAVPPAPREDPAMVAEREAFDAAKTSDTLDGWRAFKRAFPDSRLGTTADIRIAALKAAAAPAPASIPVPPTVPAPSPASAAAPEPSPAVVAAAPARAEAAAPPPQTLAGGVRDCAACPELVRLPGGAFEMGDIAGTGEADEKPLRSINLAPFYAGRYEVTFDDWAACVAAGGCAGTPSDAGWGRGRRPVINVSWDDAQRYAAWLARATGRRYRLPTEAEFEYLLRAGARSVYPWGEDEAAACTWANVADRQARKQNPDWSTFPCDDGQPLTAPAGSFRANALGLFDVPGNVWEWTQDCYGSYRQAPADGAAHDPGQCARRVIRGGSWSDARRNLRSADRTASAPGARLKIVGFRVVRD